jgi:hypothetical protein
MRRAALFFAANQTSCSPRSGARTQARPPAIVIAQPNSGDFSARASDRSCCGETSASSSATTSCTSQQVDQLGLLADLRRDAQGAQGLCIGSSPAALAGDSTMISLRRASPAATCPAIQARGLGLPGCAQCLRPSRAAWSGCRARQRAPAHPGVLPHGARLSRDDRRHLPTTAPRSRSVVWSRNPCNSPSPAGAHHRVDGRHHRLRVAPRVVAAQQVATQPFATKACAAMNTCGSARRKR